MDELLVDRFKDTIVTDIGEILISNTQKLRVLIVQDFDTKKHVVSAQKWWRASVNDEWRINKGLKVNKERGLILADLITKACGEL